MENIVRTILITGATGNVGIAVSDYAEEWLQSLPMTYNDQGMLTYRVARSLTNDFDRDEINYIDLSKWSAADYFVSKVLEHKVDMVIMAHGTQEQAPIIYHTETYWDGILNNNLTSCAALCSALARYDKLADGSLIIGMSSIQAMTPRFGRSAYAAAKAGLEGYLRTLAVELAPKTRVIGLRLGQLTTPMKNIHFDAATTDKLKARALVDWVTPEDVAKLCFDLYEQKSMTGAIIDVDSGHGRNVW